MSDETASAAPNKQEQDALLANGLTLARSAEPHDQGELRRLLTSRSFLEKLDTKDEVDNLRYRTRIERVIEALGANPAMTAHESVAALAKDHTFLSEPRRTDALIRATATVRPAPAALVDFWNKHSRADDGFTNLTIRASIENGSPPAIAFFEHKVLDHEHEPDDKIAWFHTDVLSHRNDLPLLIGAERLLTAHAMPPELKSALVDSLFDHRPDEWYGEASVYVPPDPALATPEARAARVRIAKLVLTKLAPTQRQEEAIKRVTGLTRKQLAAP